jgi:stearoyl-CoA desaturase (delta-9 desaturase)
MAGIGSPASYALIHRTHHAYSDTENDPHCPTHIGVLRTWFTFWNTTKCRPSFIKDISSDKIYKFFHKNYFIVYFSTLLLFMLFGLSVAVIFISIPCVYAFHMYGSVNTLGHLPGLHGYKNFKEISGTNSRILNLLSFGEHLHNNHHNNPRLCNSTRPSEIDVSKYIISILVYLGVCTYTV